jgi:iron complex transport system ATP-binding protein
MPIFEFDRVSFQYCERSIFRNLSAQIFENDCIALVGQNGVGKSTLLRLAAGILTPNSGEARLKHKGLRILKRHEIAQSIAFVPQNVEIPFSFTVEQIVEQGRTPFLKMFGGLDAEDRKAIGRAMELTDTSYLRSRAFNELSGGERQRVKIALGLAQQPQLLLLDEPMQHLDIGRQFEMLDLIGALRNEGIAILASMHDLSLIEGAFSSVWLLNQDEAMRQGTPKEMLQPQLLEHAFHCSLRHRPRLVEDQRSRLEQAI